MSVKSALQVQHANPAWMTKASETAKNIGTTVSNGFSNIIKRLGEMFNALKGNAISLYGRAREALYSMPAEKRMAAAGLAIGAVITALFFSCCRPKAEAKVDAEVNDVPAAEGTTPNAAVVAPVVPAPSDAAPKTTAVVEPAAQPATTIVEPAK